MIKHILLFIFTIASIFQANAQWTLDNLSIARSMTDAVEYNGKIYFIGGTNFDLPFADWSLANKKIDIYDINTATFDSLFIPDQRPFSLATIYNDKLYTVGDGNIMSTYDFVSETWESSTLQNVNEAYRMAKLDNYLLLSNQFGSLSLYDMDTDTYKSVEMPEKTALVAMTACGGKFIMAGGGYPYDNTDLVQIYDPSSDTWTNTQLSEAKANLGGACRDGFAYFAGGATDVDEYTNKVEIYDVTNDSWTLDEIAVGREELTISATDNAIYIGGGYKATLDPKYPTDVSVFTSPTDSKTITLPQGRLQMGIFGAYEKVYFFGGANTNKKDYTARIDIFDELTVGLKDFSNEIPSFNIYPNPAIDKLTISEDLSIFKGGTYSIISSTGMIISTGTFQKEINIANLATGNYQLIIQTENMEQTKRASFIKI